MPHWRFRGARAATTSAAAEPRREREWSADQRPQRRTRLPYFDAYRALFDFASAAAAGAAATALPARHAAAVLAAAIAAGTRRRISGPSPPPVARCASASPNCRRCSGSVEAASPSGLATGGFDLQSGMPALRVRMPKRQPSARSPDGQTPRAPIRRRSTPSKSGGENHEDRRHQLYRHRRRCGWWSACCSASAWARRTISRSRRCTPTST